MEIIKSKRKKGLYCSQFIIDGLNEHGKPCSFIITTSQANTFKKAIEYWENNWGNRCKAFTIRNSEPINLQAYC
jgi:hypothetical protein